MVPINQGFVKSPTPSQPSYDVIARQSGVQDSSGQHDDFSEAKLTPAEGRTSLGSSVVASNGFNPQNLPTYLTQNFVPSISTKGGLPLQIDAVPDDNKSANQLGVPCLFDNELAITTTPPPGLLDYYVERGLLNSKEQVVSLNCKTSRGVQHGFPGVDPTSLAVGENIALNNGYFVSAFTSNYIREQAAGLGLLPVQSSSSDQTNDKVGFMAAGRKFGFTVCNHIHLKSTADILRAVERYRNEDVWVKFSHAFGGDLLFKVPHPVTVTALENVLGKMRKSILTACSVNSYGAQMGELIWPSNRSLPSHFGITVEKDARWIAGGRAPGRILFTGSNLMQVRNDGTFSIVSDFEQIIGPAGDFWGSRSYSPSEKFGDDVASALEGQMAAVATYCTTDLSLFGLVGVDYMLIETPAGEVVPVMVELNGRPPISACSHIVGTEKLGAPAWISRYAWAPKELTSFADLKELLTIAGEDLSLAEVEDGAVIPMCLASVCNKSAKGEYVTLVPKRWGQLLVAGESTEHCLSVYEKLASSSGLAYERPDLSAW